MQKLKQLTSNFADLKLEIQADVGNVVSPWVGLGSLGEVRNGELCQARGWLRSNQRPPEDGDDGGKADEAAGREKSAPGGSLLASGGGCAVAGTPASNWSRGLIRQLIYGGDLHTARR